MTMQQAARTPIGASQRQTPDQRQSGRGERRSKPHLGLTRTSCIEKAQVNEQLAHESVQWRQAADCYGSDQKEDGSARHFRQQASKLIDLARVASMNHRACA